MTHAVDLRITAKIEGSVGVSADLGNPVQPLSAKAILDLVTGTTTGKADLVFSDTRTLAASASENLDLAGGLTDVFGAAITFAKIVAIYIKASSANTNSVLIGGAASNGFFGFFNDATDILKLPPGASVLLTNDAGFTVTAATGDILKAANSAAGTSVSYDIVAVGRSA